ncbi:MAG: alpha/beta hydrolase [Pseudomonadota bacterium]
MPLIKANNTTFNTMQLRCKSEESPEDLVMIHGLAANMGFWLQDFAPHFAERFRVTLYDLRGHGRSPVTKSGYTPGGMADDLRALLDTLNIRKAHFIAHSFGGVAALKLACAEPERFSSLVLADSHISSERLKEKDIPWKAGENLQAALHQCNLALDVRHPYFGFHLITAVSRMRKNGQEIPEALYPWVKNLLSGNDRQASGKWLELMDTTNAGQELMEDDRLSKDGLRKITCPVLGIYGEKSKSVLTGRYLSSVWPPAEFSFIPDAGHFFPRAQPATVMSLCGRFWDGLRS